MSSPAMMAALDGNVDRGAAAIAVFWVFGLFAMLITAGRFYARSMIKATGTDDWWMLGTLVVFLAFACVVTYSASLGGFRHSFYVDPQNMPKVALNFSVMGALGIFSFGSGKISVSCLIMRLLPPGSLWYKRLLWFIMLSTALNTVLNIILAFVECNPPKALWEPNIPHTCWAPTVSLGISYAGTSYNIFVDAFLAVMPVGIIWNLKMSFRQRLKLCILLGLGLLAAICGIVKITFLAALVIHEDITWDTYHLVVWSGAEIFVIIICGSVPPLKPLWDRHTSKKQGTNRGSYPCNSAENQYPIRGPYMKTRASAGSQDHQLVSLKRLHDGGEIMATTDIEMASTHGSSLCG